MAQGLGGLRVLLVEDSEYLGELLHDVLQDAGAIVVGPAGSAAEALELLHEPVDVACLDIQLGRETSFGLADHLEGCGIPFLFVTVCNRTILPHRHRHQHLLDKMDLPDALVPACLAVHAGMPPPAAVEPSHRRSPGSRRRELW